MLEITIPTEARRFQWTQERTKADGSPATPISWEASIAPADATLQVRTGNESASTYYIVLAKRCVKAITLADCGGPVAINGKPATDASMLDVVLSNFVGLSIACGREAERLGQLVEVERGN